jgi:hypothetical protein
MNENEEYTAPVPLKRNIPTEEEKRKFLGEALQRHRRVNAMRRDACMVAMPALDRLAVVLQGRSGQPYKVRALLYSEIVGLDWEIRQDLVSVLLAFGYEGPTFLWSDEFPDAQKFDGWKNPAQEQARETELDNLHGPRVWPKQVIAMCQETLNCLSTLRGCQKSGALMATHREIEDMASELDKVSKCAATLATDFREGGGK